MKNIVELNQENLELIPSSVLVPSYNRDAVKTSIVHIGVGNFHRSHQAFYTDELMNKYGVLDYGICGIGLLDYDRKIYNILKDQDGLYTLLVKGHDGSYVARIIASIVEYIFAPENPIAVIEKMAHPDIKIISMTITEGGYNLNKATGKFDYSNPVIVEDMKNPNSPKTVFGYLSQALKLRMLRNIGGCTIQSCDNIQENGKVIKNALLSYVEKAEPQLATWIEANVSFPNSMVDRITPVTVIEDSELLNNEFLIDDQWPVVCEPFIQWVVEDNFINGRPKWEKAGVQFVENVIPFEQMKLRLLNAGHSILGFLGAIQGYETIDEAANDEEIIAFLKNFMDIEVSPTLGDLGELNLESYKESLFMRFKNNHIKDLISRICYESSSKVPIFLLSTLKDQLNTGGQISHLAFVIATWCRYNDGVDKNGKTYSIEDDMSNILIRAAAYSHQDPVRFIEIEKIFGDLSKNERFKEEFIKSLKMIREKSLQECLQLMNEKVNVL